MNLPGTHPCPGKIGFMRTDVNHKQNIVSYFTHKIVYNLNLNSCISLSLSYSCCVQFTNVCLRPKKNNNIIYIFTIHKNNTRISVGYNKKNNKRSKKYKRDIITIVEHKDI